jgi:hypothetical protein
MNIIINKNGVVEISNGNKMAKEILATSVRTVNVVDKRKPCSPKVTTYKIS